MKRSTVAVGCASVVIVALGLVWGGRILETREAAGSRAFAPGYPDEWKVASLAEARSQVDFPVIVPNHPVANEENLTATYVRPGGAWVEMQFPAPAETDSRQDHLAVFLMSWSGGDPSEAYARDLAEAPAEGKSMLVVEGIEAVGTTAYSTTDVDKANPTHLWFIHEGLEFELSGGDNLERLIEIAETIVKPTPQVEATP